MRYDPMRAITLSLSHLRVLKFGGKSMLSFIENLQSHLNAKNAKLDEELHHENIKFF